MNEGRPNVPAESLNERDASEESATSDRAAWFGLGAAVAVAIAWGVFVLWWAASGGGENAFQSPGQFGDAFGPFTGLANALALGAAIWAIKLQREELKLQRRDLKLSIDELAGQREALTKQVKQQAEAIKQQKRDHFLAREAHRASLLKMKLDLLAHPQLLGSSEDILNGRMPMKADGTHIVSEDRRTLVMSLAGAALDLKDMSERLTKEPMMYLSATVLGEHMHLVASGGTRSRKRYRVHNLTRTGPLAQHGATRWDDDGFSSDSDEYWEAVGIARDETKALPGDHLVVIQDDGLILWDSKDSDQGGGSR